MVALGIIAVADLMERVVIYAIINIVLFFFSFLDDGIPIFQQVSEAGSPGSFHANVLTIPLFFLAASLVP